MTDPNVYQVNTLIQLGVTFYNTALNQPADPTNVALFVEDPNFNVTQIAANLKAMTLLAAPTSSDMRIA